jgi:CBS domain-containing protein
LESEGVASRASETVAAAATRGGWPHLERFLDEAAKRAASEPAKIRIRDLLKQVEAERRGTRVVEEIQQALDRHGLITDPPFASGWIDNVVEVRPVEPVTQAARGTLPGPAELSEENSLAQEPGLTVSSLRSAGAGAASVERNDSLERARAVMLRHDYSQLAVISGPRRLMGAVSWESIALAAIRSSTPTLRESIVPARPVSPDDDLIALIPTIIQHGFVFVLRPDQTLGGVVTTADLSEQFGTLATPFLLLGEIEQRLRRVLTRSLSADELEVLRDPSDAERQVGSAHDLSLGEIVRCVENPSYWERLSWPVDRSEFVQAIHEVREIRNEVMHFSPDPLTDEQDRSLRNFVRWIRVMDTPD